jgi:hypothetical protein
MRRGFAVSAGILKECIIRDKKLVELSYECTNPVSRRIIPNKAMSWNAHGDRPWQALRMRFDNQNAYGDRPWQALRMRFDDH